MSHCAQMPNVTNLGIPLRQDPLAAYSNDANATFSERIYRYVAASPFMSNVVSATGAALLAIPVLALRRVSSAAEGLSEFVTFQAVGSALVTTYVALSALCTCIFARAEANNAEFPAWSSTACLAIVVGAAVLLAGTHSIAIGLVGASVACMVGANLGGGRESELAMSTLAIATAAITGGLQVTNIAATVGSEVTWTAITAVAATTLLLTVTHRISEFSGVAIATLISFGGGGLVVGGVVTNARNVVPAAITSIGIIMGGSVVGLLAILLQKIRPRRLEDRPEDRRISNFCTAILANHFATYPTQEISDRESFQAAMGQDRLSRTLVSQLMRCATAPSELNVPPFLLSLREPRPFLERIRALQVQFQQLSKDQKSRLDLLADELPEDEALATLWREGRALAGSVVTNIRGEDAAALWEGFSRAADT